MVKEKILKIWKHNSTVLFEGVTSSGKTEVYSHLINRFLKKGYQILFLMPEISLTIQMVSRLKKILENIYLFIIQNFLMRKDLRFGIMF